MRIPKIFLFLGVLAYCLNFNNALAQEGEEKTEPVEGLFDMSLEDLMNVTVTSASKKEEKSFDAPSVITTITAKEIESFVGASLYEILERSPAFYGLSSVAFRKSAIGLRGDLPTHLNPRILFLIDGRPFKESVMGGQNAAILSAFPVYSIKHIEIIRGPGSVLYGSNAYIGVVNIITKDQSKKPGITARGGGGSFGTKSFQVNGGTSLSDVKINGGFSYLNSDGWHFADSVRIRGPFRQFGENDFGEDILAANLKLGYKGLSLSGFYGSNDMGHITPATSSASIYKNRRLFLNLGYDEELVKDFYRISANVTYNNQRDEFDIGFFNNGTSVRYPWADDYVFELTNFFKFHKKIELTVGGSFYDLSGEFATKDPNVSTVPEYNQKWIHGYAQTDYKPTEWLKLVFGGQLNKVNDLDINFVPRLAAIASHKSGFGTKIMYGEAFRAPYPTETEIKAVPTVEGELNLVPENIATFETQLFYSTSKGRVAVTYFNSKQTELITRIPNPSPSYALIYATVGGQTSSGVEIETKYSVLESLYVKGSYSYQTTEDDNGNKNLSLIPQHMVKIGASLNIKKYFNLGVFNSYYSSPINLANPLGQSLGELSAYNWLTAKLDVSVSNLLKIDKMDFGVTLEGANLLDQKVYNPELTFKHFNAVQTHPGISFNAGAYVRF